MSLNRMYLRPTSAQLTALDKFNAAYDDSWAMVDHDKDGTIEVTVHPGGLHRSFDRYVRPDGMIVRWDNETDREELADENPLVGRYQATYPGDVTRLETYNY